MSKKGWTEYVTTRNALLTGAATIVAALIIAKTTRTGSHAGSKVVAADGGIAIHEEGDGDVVVGPKSVYMASTPSIADSALAHGLLTWARSNPRSNSGLLPGWADLPARRVFVANVRKLVNDLPWSQASAPEARDHLGKALDKLGEAISTTAKGKGEDALLLIRNIPLANVPADSPLRHGVDQLAWLIAAVILDFVDDPLAAADELSKLIEAGAGPQAILMRGVMLGRAGRSQDALSDLSLALSAALSPELRAAVFYTQGLLLVQEGNVGAAIDSYRSSLDEDPCMVRSLLNLGNHLADSGDYEAALPLFTKAIGCEPNYGLAYGSRGKTLNHLGRFEDAVQDLDICIKLNPTDADAHNEKSVSLIKMKRFEEAKELLEEGLSIAPDDGAINLNMADVLLALREPTSALPYAQRAANALPYVSHAHILLGETQNALQQFSEAVLSFRKAMSLEQSSERAKAGLSDAQYNVGLEHDRAGSQEQAIDWYSKAIALDPQHMQALTQRGRLKLGSGDAAGAVTDLDTAWDESEPNRIVGLNYHHALLANEQLSDAKRVALALVLQDPENRDLMVKIVLRFREFDKLEAAQDVIKGARSELPNSSTLKRAEADLKELMDEES